MDNSTRNLEFLDENNESSNNIQIHLQSILWVESSEKVNSIDKQKIGLISNIIDGWEYKAEIIHPKRLQHKIFDLRNIFLIILFVHEIKLKSLHYLIFDD